MRPPQKRSALCSFAGSYGGKRMEDWLLDSGIDYIHLVVEREQVDAQDDSEPLGALLALLDSRARVDRFANRVSVTFHGYESDQRELFEVPEVRRYVRALDEGFPFWLWFLDCKSFSPTLIVECSVDLVAQQDGGPIAHLTFAPGVLGRWLTDHFGALNSLAARFSLPTSVVEEVGERVAAHFGHYRHQRRSDALSVALAASHQHP